MGRGVSAGNSLPDSSLPDSSLNDSMEEPPASEAEGAHR